MTERTQDPMVAKLIDLNERLIAQGLMGEDELTGDDFENIVVPTPWKFYLEFEVTEEMNEMYTYTLQDANPWYRDASPYGRALVHPIALVQLGTRPVLAQFGVNIPEGESSLHAKMEIEFVAPAFADAAISSPRDGSWIHPARRWRDTPTPEWSAAMERRPNHERSPHR
jgi:hypothetical protein